MRIVKKILMIIVTFFLVLLLIFNAYNFISVKILKKDVASVGGYTLLEVVTGSMEPTIHIGDLIVIQLDTSYEVNDIVTFYDVDGSFVTHRIKAIENNQMITKGDNNNTEDEPISLDKIVGKYQFKITGAGKILSAFKSPLTMFLILVIGLLFCYLVSTDKEGRPILTEEEKEWQEFQNLKKKKGKKEEKIENEKEWIEKKIESLFQTKREVNNQIRALLEKKKELEKENKLSDKEN